MAKTAQLFFCDVKMFYERNSRSSAKGSLTITCQAVGYWTRYKWVHISRTMPCSPSFAPILSQCPTIGTTNAKIPMVSTLMRGL